MALHSLVSMALIYMKYATFVSKYSSAVQLDFVYHPSLRFLCLRTIFSIIEYIINNSGWCINHCNLFLHKASLIWQSSVEV